MHTRFEKEKERKNYPGHKKQRNEFQKKHAAIVRYTFMFAHSRELYEPNIFNDRIYIIFSTF